MQTEERRTGGGLYYTLCQILFRLFGSQPPAPCLLGSVPPRGVMVTAAAEAWAMTVEAERAVTERATTTRPGLN